MTPEICIDANIFVASLIPQEPDHEVAHQLVHEVLKQGTVMYEPPVVLSEVVAAIYRKVFDGELLEERRDPLIELFFELPLLVQWQSVIMKRAARTAQSLSLRRMSDCLYLALAMQREIPIVTLDSDFIKKGKRVYRRIVSASEFLKIN